MNNKMISKRGKLQVGSQERSRGLEAKTGRLQVGSQEGSSGL